ITHLALSEQVNKKIDDTKLFKKVSKLPSDFDNQQLDWAYGPVIQSGGEYDMRTSAQSNEKNLHSGCIISGLGFRYKTYCAALARTFLIDPSKPQTTNYKILLAAHDAALKESRDGATAKDVYNKALGVIKSKKPELEKHFGKNVGAAIGIELRDASLVLNGKNT
ncbi:MAG: FACT complex subunit spt16, partial [Watsoniomyces obsoletus]